MTLPATRQPQSRYRHLYLQVLAAIILGVLVGHFFPATGASGVDRFMSEARASTNLIGNGVATVVVARWERELDMVRMHAELNGRDYIATPDARMAQV